MDPFLEALNVCGLTDEQAQALIDNGLTSPELLEDMEEVDIEQLVKSTNKIGANAEHPVNIPFGSVWKLKVFRYYVVLRVRFERESSVFRRGSV